MRVWCVNTVNSDVTGVKSALVNILRVYITCQIGTQPSLSSPSEFFVVTQKEMAIIDMINRFYLWVRIPHWNEYNFVSFLYIFFVGPCDGRIWYRSEAAISEKFKLEGSGKEMKKLSQKHRSRPLDSLNENILTFWENKSSILRIPNLAKSGSVWEIGFLLSPIILTKLFWRVSNSPLNPKLPSTSKLPQFNKQYWR